MKWSIVGTGGNCTAWELLLPGGRRIWATQVNAPAAPSVDEYALFRLYEVDDVVVAEWYGTWRSTRATWKEADVASWKALVLNLPGGYELHATTHVGVRPPVGNDAPALLQLVEQVDPGAYIPLARWHCTWEEEDLTTKKG